MATQPKPFDPAAAALSAIEEALNITGADHGKTSAPAPTIETHVARHDDAAAEAPAVQHELRLPEIGEDELPRVRMDEPVRKTR